MVILKDNNFEILNIHPRDLEALNIILNLAESKLKTKVNIGDFVTEELQYRISEWRSLIPEEEE